MHIYRTPFFLLTLFSAIVLTWLAFSKTEKRAVALQPKQIGRSYKASSKEPGPLHFKASLAKNFARERHFDTSVGFFIDMSLPSNQKRFFIYDYAHDSIESSGLVTHGNCNQLWLEGRMYGNEVGCGCTSLGKYKIGNAYYGKFGLAFKLHGLDKTNDNAFKRYVVLHSHSCVPESEVEGEICQSSGCPTVAPQFLQRLSNTLYKAKRPVLLWIYE